MDFPFSLLLSSHFSDAEWGAKFQAPPDQRQKYYIEFTFKFRTNGPLIRFMDSNGDGG